MGIESSQITVAIKVKYQYKHSFLSSLLVRLVFGDSKGLSPLRPPRCLGSAPALCLYGKHGMAYMMEINATSSPSSVSKPRYISLDRALPVSTACEACRSRHQRCDGTMPICLRCNKGNRSCNYAPSRRGRSIAHLHPRKAQVPKINALASDSILGLDIHISRQCCSRPRLQDPCAYHY